MEKRDLVLGDVVQLSPTKASTAMPGCFAQVEEVHDWGVFCWVQIPQGHRPKGVVHFTHELAERKLAGRAYVRVTWQDMEFIGHAYWIGEP